MPDAPAIHSTPTQALLVTRRDIAALMSLQDYVTAVEAGFRAYAAGDAHVAPPMHLPARGGTFHAKGASLVLDRAYVALVRGLDHRSAVSRGVRIVRKTLGPPRRHGGEHDVAAGPA